MLGLSQGIHVLVVGAGTGTTARLVAKEFGATVVAIDPDAAAVAELGRLAQADGTASLVTGKHVPGLEVPFPDEDFDAVICDAGLLRFGGAEGILSRFGPKVRRGGGLAFTEFCRIGPRLPPELVAAWDPARGPLRTAGALLLTFHPRGYEPIAAEALPEAVLDSWYTALQTEAERLLASSPAGTLQAAAARARDEALLWRRAGRNVIGAALVVGRRLEATGLSPGFARRTRE